MSPEKHPHHAGGAKTLADELQRLADEADQDDDERGRRVAELAARLGLIAYHLHVRLDRLQGQRRRATALWLALAGAWALSGTLAALHACGLL